MLLTPYYFNSRPSARGDREAVQLCREENISIHAPPRGATWKLDRFSRSRYISIHAPPRGATEPRRLADRVANAFQFTPLREGRPRRHGTPRLTRADFNSRPSARGDNPDTTTGRDNHISIHAPPRGATQSARRSCPACKHFNSRPSARGDRFHRPEEHHLSISIHAPPRGATDIANDWLQETLISIHAPPRGATGCQRPPWRGRQNFNSRPSARGDPDEFAAMIAA